MINPHIGAIVLAAGMSRRMGQPKLLLPWGTHTILAHILTTLTDAGVTPILVVLGGFGEKIREITQDFSVTLVENPDYAGSEMISSLKIGLTSAKELKLSSVFIVLGDQPMLSLKTLHDLQEEYLSTGQPIIIPSYHMKRGHPWIICKELWDEVIHLPDSQTLREFLNQHQADIQYLNVDDPDILKDIDTWEDYIKLKPM
jgi:molybdenum cofactor cytidylyltransferase